MDVAHIRWVTKQAQSNRITALPPASFFAMFCNTDAITYLIVRLFIYATIQPHHIRLSCFSKIWNPWLDFKWICRQIINSGSKPYRSDVTGKIVHEWWHFFFYQILVSCRTTSTEQLKAKWSLLLICVLSNVCSSDFKRWAAVAMKVFWLCCATVEARRRIRSTITILLDVFIVEWRPLLKNTRLIVWRK